MIEFRQPMFRQEHQVFGLVLDLTANWLVSNGRTLQWQRLDLFDG
jgi:hypothetical protein